APCIPARISVSGYGEKLVLRARHFCEGKGAWQKTGKVRAVYPALYKADEGTVVLETLSYPQTFFRIYHLKVWLGHRRIDRYLEVVHGTRHAERVYEGTDAFVNYCINEGRRIESANHRLFCTRPGRSGHAIFLYRNRPS